MSQKPEAPAIGYSITANLADDRQVVFQHFVGQDDDDAAFNGALDRIMTAIDRQQARYKIPGLQEEKRRLEGQIFQSEADLAHVEADYQARVADRNRRVLDLASEEKQIRDAAYAESTGRRGGDSGKLVGQAKANVDRIGAGKQKLIEEAAKDDAEREVAVQNLKTNNEARRLRMRQIDEQIAELQQKV